MSATQIFIAVIAIAFVGCHVYNVTFSSYDVIGMAVVVPCVTAALYRAFTVFGIGK